jgi:hypothetical protein
MHIAIRQSTPILLRESWSSRYSRRKLVTFFSGLATCNAVYAGTLDLHCAFCEKPRSRLPKAVM